MTDWLHGVDVSHYQADSQIPWTLIAQTSKFAVVKASDGVAKDPACIDHVKRARAFGLTVGVYHFFRNTIPVVHQIATFASMADAVGLGPGDLLPALDIEDFPGHQIGPHTSAPAEEWCSRATDAWGSALVYLTQRDWHRLGAPDWVLQYPGWVAHYPGRELPGPATPGVDWRIWQYSVHPYAPGVWTNDFKAAKAIDHNWARDPLPVIAHPGQVAPEPPRITHVEPTYLTDIDWDEFRKARDAAVRDEDA